jgi:hypothetical protein
MFTFLPTHPHSKATSHRSSVLGVNQLITQQLPAAPRVPVHTGVAGRMCQYHYTVTFGPRCIQSGITHRQTDRDKISIIPARVFRRGLAHARHCRSGTPQMAIRGAQRRLIDPARGPPIQLLQQTSKTASSTAGPCQSEGNS